MADFTVNRRGTQVIPSSVVLGNRVNSTLNILFITWSVLVIIMYFVNINIPDYVDISVSMLAICIAVSHQIYTFIEYKRSGVYKVNIEPLNTKPLQKNSINNIDLLDLDKVKIII